MNLRTVIPFVVAIGLGVVAVQVGRPLLNKRPAAGPARKLVSVVVAKRDLEPGYQLQAGDLTTAEMPVESAPQTAVRNASEIVGRIVSSPVAKGQTVVERALAVRDAGLGLQTLVPPGMRAVTIDVSEVTGMVGLIMPGCHVDVLATLTNEDGVRRTVARTIVENVKVTAVGTAMAPKPAGNEPAARETARNVTLMVTPKQAEAIELAATKARPRLVLRGGKDDVPVRTIGVTITELLGGAAQWPGEKMQLSGAMLASLAGAVQERLKAMPTTRPVETKPIAPPVVLRRSVQLIKGGVESVKQFDITPVASGTGVTGGQ
ncbi:MAG: Flp pilus assembly protein CpaB [Bacillota bacterium]